MLVDGRVIGAPQVMEPITLDQIETVFATAAPAQSAAALLDGTLTPAPDSVAVYEPQGTGGDAAQLTGTLTLQGGCTYVVDQNDTTWLPIFARVSRPTTPPSPTAADLRLRVDRLAHRRSERGLARRHHPRRLLNGRRLLGA